MKTIIEQIINEVHLFYTNKKIIALDEIKQSGSDRLNFRLHIENIGTVIATYNNNVAENKTFIERASLLAQQNINVPTILYVSHSQQIYFQTDVANLDLLTWAKNLINKPNIVYDKYSQVVDDLCRIQLIGKQFNFKQSYSFEQFSNLIILQDLFYFKNFFLDVYKINYHPKELVTEFDYIVKFFSTEAVTPFYRFMYRDFQARNILINNEEKLFYIDFQGGMLGPVQYDIISLLFQAKANLPDEWKQKILALFKQKVKHTFTDNQFNDINYQTTFNFCFLMRQLQILGVYGFRGKVQGKEHFKMSLKPALQQLCNYKNVYLNSMTNIPHIISIINQISASAFIEAIE